MTMRKILAAGSIALLLVVIPGAVALHAQAPAGPKVGIVVHGHWVIDIREPDGRLVNHLDFENALQTTGGDLLANILARRKTPGRWSISLSNIVTNDQPCTLFVLPQGYYDYQPCRLQEGQNLTLDQTGLVLSGTVAATTVGHIGFVSTYLMSCPPTILPSGCRFDNPEAALLGIEVVNFSATEVTAYPQVLPQQLISVTVTFTFQAAH